jgi:hypothetical protein
VSDEVVLRGAVLFRVGGKMFPEAHVGKRLDWLVRGFQNSTMRASMYLSHPQNCQLPHFGVSANSTYPMSDDLVRLASSSSLSSRSGETSIKIFTRYISEETDAQGQVHLDASAVTSRQSFEEWKENRKTAGDYEKGFSGVSLRI